MAQVPITTSATDRVDFEKSGYRPPSIPRTITIVTAGPDGEALAFKDLPKWRKLKWWGVFGAMAVICLLSLGLGLYFGLRPHQ